MDRRTAMAASEKMADPLGLKNVFLIHPPFSAGAESAWAAGKIDLRGASILWIYS
jgi:hypothetical protein